MIRAAHFDARKGFEKIWPVRLRCAGAVRSAILVYARARQRNRWAGIAGGFSNEMRRAFADTSNYADITQIPARLRHYHIFWDELDGRAELV